MIGITFHYDLIKSPQSQNCFCYCFCMIDQNSKGYLSPIVLCNFLNLSSSCNHTRNKRSSCSTYLMSYTSPLTTNQLCNMLFVNNKKISRMLNGPKQQIPLNIYGYRNGYELEFGLWSQCR